MKSLNWKLILILSVGFFFACTKRKTEATSEAAIQEVPSSLVSKNPLDPGRLEKIVVISDKVSGGLNLAETKKEDEWTDSQKLSLGILGGAGAGLTAIFVGILGYKYFKVNKPSSQKGTAPHSDPTATPSALPRPTLPSGGAALPSSRGLPSVAPIGAPPSTYITPSSSSLTPSSSSLSSSRSSSSSSSGSSNLNSGGSVPHNNSGGTTPNPNPITPNPITPNPITPNPITQNPIVTTNFQTAHVGNDSATLSTSSTSSTLDFDIFVNQIQFTRLDFPDLPKSVSKPSDPVSSTSKVDDPAVNPTKSSDDLPSESLLPEGYIFKTYPKMQVREVVDDIEVSLSVLQTQVSKNDGLVESVVKKDNPSVKQIEEAADKVIKTGEEIKQTGVDLSKMADIFAAQKMKLKPSTTNTQNPPPVVKDTSLIGALNPQLAINRKVHGGGLDDVVEESDWDDLIKAEEGLSTSVKDLKKEVAANGPKIPEMKQKVKEDIEYVQKKHEEITDNMSEDISQLQATIPKSTPQQIRILESNLSQQAKSIEANKTAVSKISPNKPENALDVAEDVQALAAAQQVHKQKLGGSLLAGLNSAKLKKFDPTVKKAEEPVVTPTKNETPPQGGQPDAFGDTWKKIQDVKAQNKETDNVGNNDFEQDFGLASKSENLEDSLKEAGANLSTADKKVSESADKLQLAMDANDTSKISDAVAKLKGDLNTEIKAQEHLLEVEKRVLERIRELDRSLGKSVVFIQHNGKPYLMIDETLVPIATLKSSDQNMQGLTPQDSDGVTIVLWDEASNLNAADIKSKLQSQCSQCTFENLNGVKGGVTGYRVIRNPS